MAAVPPADVVAGALAAPPVPPVGVVFGAPAAPPEPPAGVVASAPAAPVVPALGVPAVAPATPVVPALGVPAVASAVPVVPAAAMVLGLLLPQPWARSSCDKSATVPMYVADRIVIEALAFFLGVSLAFPLVGARSSHSFSQTSP